MARQLNPKLREDILYYAKKIMHEEGYDALSMRKIANETDMVVGNVYRYFKNKDALLAEIFSPLIDKLRVFLNVRFDNVYEIYPTKKELMEFIDERTKYFSTKFETILESDYLELQIMIKNQTFSADVRQCINDMIKSLLNAYATVEYESYDQVGVHLVDMFSQSIMYGIFNAINTYPDNKENLQLIIRSYLKIFSKLLETDILDVKLVDLD